LQILERPLAGSFFFRQEQGLLVGLEVDKTRLEMANRRAVNGQN